MFFRGRDKEENRVVFPPGGQGRYLRAVRARLGLPSWAALAELCGYSEEAMGLWAREKTRSMPEEVVRRLSALSGVAPAGAEVVPAREYERESKQRAGRASTREITRPGRTPQLAYFCAVLLGDGHIRTDGKHIKITNHAVEEREYTERQVALVRELFGLPASIYEGSGGLVVSISSVKLVQYLTSAEIGLHIGNKVKQQVSVPQWMLKGDRATRAATVRGLIDTDGSICLLNNKRSMRGYVRIFFGNGSQPLVRGMERLLQDLGYHPSFSWWGHGGVGLNRQEEIRRYMREIGTANRHRYKCYLRAVAAARADGVEEWQNFSPGEALFIS